MSASNPGAARAALHCAICNKSYARAQELDKHTMSYEHTHNVRREELRAMQRNMNATSKPKIEDPDGVLRSVEVTQTVKKADGKKKGFKKSGFVSVTGVGGKPDVSELVAEAMGVATTPLASASPADVEKKVAAGNEEKVGQGEENAVRKYNPRFAIGCGPTCSCPVSRARYAVQAT